MNSSLISGLQGLEATNTNALLVMDYMGKYRIASDDEVLLTAQRICSQKLRGGEEITSPEALKQFLSLRLGNLDCEVFAVVFLDSQHRFLDYSEMFRGTLNQTSVYPREVVIECLKRSAGAVIFVHNHPSGLAHPSAADEKLTQTLKTALTGC